MHALTKWIAAPLVAAGLMFAGDASTADAGNGFFRIGGGGIQLSVGGGHYGNHYGYSPNYRSSYRPSYGYGGNSYRSHYGGSRYGGSHYGGGYYHDTSHYDYHPTEVIRHGNHYDVVPGHYDFHQTGHHH